jgi:hypothetical protein
MFRVARFVVGRPEIVLNRFQTTSSRIGAAVCIAGALALPQHHRLQSQRLGDRFDISSSSRIKFVNWERNCRHSQVFCNLFFDLDSAASTAEFETENQLQFFQLESNETIEPEKLETDSIENLTISGNLQPGTAVVAVDDIDQVENWFLARFHARAICEN